MTHWAGQYCGKKWAKDKDCFYWFRRITLEQFGHEVKIIDVDHTRLIRSASRLMSSDIEAEFGYKLVTDPSEGDAVFMTQRKTPHHIGIAIFLQNKFHVLHAVEGMGMVVSDKTDLLLNGWSIQGYWHYES